MPKIIYLYIIVWPWNGYPYHQPMLFCIKGQPIKIQLSANNHHGDALAVFLWRLCDSRTKIYSTKRYWIYSNLFQYIIFSSNEMPVIDGSFPYHGPVLCVNQITPLLLLLKAPSHLSLGLGSESLHPLLSQTPHFPSLMRTFLYVC